MSKTQLALPSEMVGLGVLSALLFAFHDFLTSDFGASDFLATILSETFEVVSSTKTQEKWLNLTNEQESPFDEAQKNYTQSVDVKPGELKKKIRTKTIRTNLLKTSRTFI